MMQTQVVYCPRCGAPNGNPHGFCGRCGQVLGPRPPAAVPGYRPAAPRPQPPAPAYRSPVPPPPAYRAPAPRVPQGCGPRGGAGYGPNRGYGAAGLIGRAPAPARMLSPQLAGVAGGGAAAAWAPQAGVYHPGSFGYPVAAAPHAATGTRRHHWGLWAAAGSLVGVILVGLLVIGLVAIRPQPTSCTGPGCAPPPRTEPLPAPHTYTSSTYHYTVRYYNTPGGYSPGLQGRVQLTKQTATGIDWSLNLDGWDPTGGTWPYGLQGMSAGGQSARQVVGGVVGQDAQGARFLFALPNAMVGFVHGYGAVYDLQVQTTDGGVVNSRYIVMAAVHNGLAVVFTALGPYTSRQLSDHPDPTDTVVSLVVGPLVNGVTFPGMPVR